MRLAEGWVGQASKWQNGWVNNWVVWKQSCKFNLNTSALLKCILHVETGWHDMFISLFFKELYRKFGHSVCVMFLCYTLVAIPWLRYDKIKVLGVLPNVACWIRHSGKDRKHLLYLVSRLNKVHLFLRSLNRLFISMTSQIWCDIKLPEKNIKIRQELL